MPFLLLALLSACHMNTNDMAIIVTCDEVVTPVDWDDASLGFTAADVLAALGSPLTLDVSWSEATPDTTSATLLVSLAEASDSTPAVVVRSDPADRPDGCGSAGGQGEGTFLRIPLNVETSDTSGTLTFDSAGMLGDGTYTLDASAPAADAVWFGWEFQEGADLESALTGTWADGVQTCLEGFFGEESREYRETRLYLDGQPAAGEVDIEVGTDGDDDASLGVCWRGVWGSAAGDTGAR